MSLVVNHDYHHHVIMLAIPTINYDMLIVESWLIMVIDDYQWLLITTMLINDQ